MKRLLAAVLLLAAATCISSQAFAALDGRCTLMPEPVRWRTSAAATVGVITDSTVFKADGSANANRDTMAWFDTDKMCAWSPGFASVGDSTVFATLTVFPLATDPYSGTTFGIGADSLYAYVEGTNDIASGSQARLLTTLTEILAEEVNSNNAFTFGISYARAALSLVKYRYIRFIVRGDLNGCWGGRLTYHRRLD